MPHETKVDDPSLAYNRMAIDWEILHDLLGGTPAMRAAGQKWLPKETAEEDQQYTTRISRSFLFNGYSSALQRLVSKPYSRPITLQNAENLDERLKAIEEDVNFTDQNLTQFGREVLWSAVNYGLTHILIDFPQMTDVKTLEEEREAGARPIFKHVKPPDLIGWRTRKDSSGHDVLAQIRIHEVEIMSDGSFGEIPIETIRVIDELEFQLWMKSPEMEEFALVQEGKHSFGAIPLVTMYTHRTGNLEANPGLEDLAWTNVEHWQSSSDQKNILRFSRFGLLFGKGLTPEEAEEGFVIGPSRVLTSSARDADLKYVEHNGKAIQSGENDIKRIEERMEILGLQPLVQKTGGVTATAIAIDESKTQSDVQAWVRAEESMLKAAYNAAAKWLSLKIPDDFKVDINNDFGISLRAMEDVKALLESRIAGEISRETYLTELKRRNVLSETVDIQEELAKIEQEGPSLSSLGIEEPDA